jgi:hypothetical protein
MEPSVFPPNHEDIVVVALGLVLLLVVSVVWVVWSRGIINGDRIGFANKARPPKLVGKLTLTAFFATSIAGGVEGKQQTPNLALRFLGDAFAIITIQLLLLWVGYWLLIWKRRVGRTNPRRGDGLSDSDFLPLVNQLNNVKLRTDIMLFGSVTLGAIWWINFAGLIASSTRLENVISLFGDLSLGMLSLGIIGLLSMAIDINLLRFSGLARLPTKNLDSRIAIAASDFMSKWGAVVFLIVIAMWALWAYFRSPFQPFDVFIFSIPLGLIWETAGKRR